MDRDVARERREAGASPFPPDAPASSTGESAKAKAPSERIIEERLPFATLRVRALALGDDWCLTLEGGQRPHVGCAVLAVPRPSLTGDGSASATSSVLNVTGHKDDALCRLVAERVCARKGAAVVCAGGFHLDGITADQIRQLETAASRLAERV